MGYRFRFGVLSFLLAAGALAACSSSDDGTATARPGGFGGGGGSSGSGGSSASGGFGGSSQPCSSGAECATGSFCSAAGHCVLNGQCGADGDCSGGTFCSVTSACIAAGTCADDGDCDTAMVCDTNGACVPGGQCGQDVFQIEAVPPNMMLVLDRSCSMRRNLANVLDPTGVNKWTLAVDAIVQLTTNFDGQIRWGLILFPDITGGDCRQDAPAVSVGPGTEAQIQQILTDALSTTDPNFPDGPCVTNIDTAMEQAGQEPAFADTTRESFAVLITDGKQAGCSVAGGDAGTEQILADMFAAGVPTFVVGFGGAIDPVQMDSFADKGGVPRSGSPKYYQADDATQLEQALGTIASSVIGCTFTLDSVPPNPNELYVFFGQSSVPRDNANGWEYDPATNQIEFFGQACDELKQNPDNVSVVFGCNQPPPP